MSALVHDTLAALARAQVTLLLVALALHCLGLVLTGARWRVVVGALGHDLTLARACLINLVGIFVRNVIPAGVVGGDACRIALLRADGMPAGRSAVSLAYTRLLEAPAVALLIVISIPTLAVFVPTIPLAGPLVVVALGMALVWLVTRRNAVQARLGGWRARLAGVQLNRRATISGMGYAAACWVETVVRLMVVAAAFGVWITFAQASTLAVLVIVAGLSPTIGSLGAVEGGLFTGLVLFGIGPETAAAITVAERAISYLFSTAAGAGAVAWLGGWSAVRVLLPQRGADAGARVAAVPGSTDIA